MKKRFYLNTTLGLLLGVLATQSINSEAFYYDENYEAFTVEESFEDGLYLFSLPSATKLSWSSPRSALLTAGYISQKVKIPQRDALKSMVGHLAVHFRCTDLKGERRNIWTGLTGQNLSEVDDYNMKVKKVGLGVILEDYHDGELETGNFTLNRVARTKAKRNPISSRPSLGLHYKLSKKQCSQAWDYYQTFENRSFDSDKGDYASWVKKPQHSRLIFSTVIQAYESYKAFKAGKTDRIGGGCTSFAMGFLKVIGAYKPEYDKLFIRQIPISDKLVSKKYRKGSYSEGQIEDGIPMMSLVFSSSAGSWTHKGYETNYVPLYDPEMIYEYISKISKAAKQGNAPKGVKLGKVEFNIVEHKKPNKRIRGNSRGRDRRKTPDFMPHRELTVMSIK